jgi:hypothetical protein
MAFGLFSTSLGLVSLPAPWIGAQMWDRVSPTFPFTITAIVILLSVIPIWIKFKPRSWRNLRLMRSSLSQRIDEIGFIAFSKLKKEFIRKELMTMAKTEERMKILKLIEEGKISAEEGAKLLSALSDSSRGIPTPPRPPGARRTGALAARPRD